MGIQPSTLYTLSPRHPSCSRLCLLRARISASAGYDGGFDWGRDSVLFLLQEEEEGRFGVRENGQEGLRHPGRRR